MRIGILTYHCPPNFGAQLQTLSTIGFLRRMGHEPIVINWYAPDLEEMYSHRIPDVQVSEHNRFALENFPLTQRFYNTDELVRGIDEYNLNAIIVGSDALFKYVPLNNRRYFSKRRLKYVYYNNPLSCEDLKENPFWGGFIPKLRKRIPVSVYAASSQNCPYLDMNFIERKKMRSALSNYKRITVRDLWTKRMIEKITCRKDIKIFPDPVFSFNKNCIHSIPTKAEIIQKYSLEEKYVLLSFWTRNCSTEYIESLACEIEKKGLQAVNLPMPEGLFNVNINKGITLPLNPLDWYALILYSSGYIGERMHPIVVCLHNAIPFFCYDEYGTMVRKSFFPSRYEYDEYTSKSFLIINEARFHTNIYSYQKNQPLPSKELVVNEILSFDKEKCVEFAKMKQKKYDEGMIEILNSLS